MEDQNIRLFLRNIIQTISAIIVWSVLHIFFGIYLKFGIIEGKISGVNIIFYILSLTTIFFLWRYVRALWRTPG